MTEATHTYHIRDNAFAAFSQINRQRAEIWHPQGLESWSLSDWFTALAGEVGELGNVIKKLNRERDGISQKQVDSAALRQMAADELADVYTYLDLMAQRLGVPLLPAVVAKFNRISEREGMPQRIELLHKPGASAELAAVNPEPPVHHQG